MSAQPSPSDVPPDVVNQMNMRDIKRAVAAKNPHLNTDSKGFRADATAMNRARDRAIFEKFLGNANPTPVPPPEHVQDGAGMGGNSDDDESETAAEAKQSQMKVDREPTKSNLGADPLRPAFVTRLRGPDGRIIAEEG